MTDGSIERRDGRVSFRYQRTLRHPIDRVWRAITDPAELQRWLGTRPELDLRPGGAYVTVHTSPDGTTSHRVVDQVVRVESPRLFEHTFWQEVNPSALVTWELTALDANGTRLDLRHALDVADLEAAANTVAGGDDLATIIARNGAGWHRLADRLTSVLDGTEAAWSAADQQQLQARYASQLD